jgi:hypothetical protein
MDPGDIARQLADLQRQLIDLPPDAFGERVELRRRQDELRALARTADNAMDADRTDAQLLDELAGLRKRMQAIERQRIDLVKQAGSGGATSSEMGNLGGVKINKAIDDAHGLPAIKARIGVIKGMLSDRGVDVPDVD